VLNNVSLNVKAGELVSIIGPNGSGKTTLLKCMSGILPPKSGVTALLGKDILSFKKRELAKLMAYVPQNTSIEFGFSVLDIVLMGRSPYLGPFQSETLDDLKIVDEAMEMTNIVHIKDKKVTEISGGERQRVIIASALAQTPKVLLLDEPVSNLDIQHQMEVLGILKRLTEEKMITVVAVLHDLNLAAEYSDTVMLLKDGRVVKSGTPLEVITADNINDAYQTNVYMTKNPVSGNPHIIPIYKS
jgi:iron complex transport system ATP-binding protein